MAKVWDQFAEQVKQSLLEAGGKMLASNGQPAVWQFIIQTEHGALAAIVNPGTNSVTVFLRGGVIDQHYGFYTPRDRGLLPHFKEVVSQSVADLSIKPFRPSPRGGKIRAKLAATIRELRQTWHDHGEQTKGYGHDNHEWQKLHDAASKLYGMVYPETKYDRHGRKPIREMSDKARCRLNWIERDAWTTDGANTYGGAIKSDSFVIPLCRGAISLGHKKDYYGKVVHAGYWIPDVSEFDSLTSYMEQRAGKLTEWTWKQGEQEAKPREYMVGLAHFKPMCGQSKLWTDTAPRREFFTGDIEISHSWRDDHGKRHAGFNPRSKLDDIQRADLATTRLFARIVPRAIPENFAQFSRYDQFQLKTGRWCAVENQYGNRFQLVTLKGRGPARDYGQAATELTEANWPAIRELILPPEL